MSLYISFSFIPYSFSVAGLAVLVSLLTTSRPPKIITPAFPKVTITTARALPASWYRSKEVYELERRAVFAKWILTSYKLWFTEVGSWVRFEQAGFPFFLVKNNQGHINGFHNICRHRAFPIMANRLNGQLTKAPGYDDMVGFDKSNNGLLPIHVHVGAKGLIWVNPDASKTPEDFSAEFKNIDQIARHEGFNFEAYHFDHSWGMSGDYN
ncbi:cytochrome P450 oxidoreductase [Fusarium austroafricanum]|uniref:Cytochrome P450 oxidoreductase n=1 Tax=Fusarium austroafricanum TaxID=2364996 RepID=A0A8H4KPX9_9HYPO|nr:cytochrome P450 oxidoreductase [Fusarium austroafricanum]